MSMPPAISTSSETHPIPEISGSSYSSKNTLAVSVSVPLDFGLRLKAPQGCLRAAGPVHSHRLSTRSSEDHTEDPRDASLIEGMDVEPAANEIGGDVRLEIGERQDEIGLQGEDLVDIR